MSEIKDEFLESNEAEKGLSSVISEYISAAPCLKISYKMTAAEIKADARSGFRRLRPFLGVMLFAVTIVSWSLFLMFIESQKQATNSYFFAAMINGFFLGVFVWPALLTLWMYIRFIKLKKKLNGISDVSVDLCFFEDCVLIITSNFMSLVVYSSKNNEFFEYNKGFVVSYKEHPEAERVSFSVHKRYLSDDEIEKIREYAKKFEERYIVKAKKYIVNIKG